MKKGAPFPPYMGGEDYLFTSYAHKDSDRVFEIITALHRDRYRVWYDEGIEVGVNWPMVVAEKLLHSARVLIFISANAITSQNCMREINYSVSQRKEMLVILLDDCKLPADLELQLSVVKKIRYSDTAQTVKEIEAELAGSLIGDGVTGYGTTAAKKRGSLSLWHVLTVVFMVLFAAAVGFLLYRIKNQPAAKQAPAQKIISTETNPEVNVSTFKDATALTIALKASEDKYIFLCGNSMVSDASAIVRKDGEWYVGEDRVPTGGITDLSAFQGKMIEQLAVVNEQIASIEELRELTELTYLDLSGNPIRDLSAISTLPKLETLRIVGISADADISVLAGMKSLRKVYISYELAASAKPLVDAGIEVILKQ